MERGGAIIPHADIRFGRVPTSSNQMHLPSVTTASIDLGRPPPAGPGQSRHLATLQVANTTGNATEPGLKLCGDRRRAVSYTHLTLPTICSV
eukprot:5429172-Alexandrium_andersonii.AAC.1